jgi:hypothetical protein
MSGWRIPGGDRTIESRPSEQGLFALSGRELDLPLTELFVKFRDQVSEAMAWTDSRKTRFRKRSSWVKIGALILSALSTIILGIQEIPARASIALPFVALVTTLGALEGFFNWRSRWVLMEEAQYRLHRLRDDVDFYLLSTPSTALTMERLRQLFDEQQAIWSDVSQKWIEFRKLDAPVSNGQAQGHQSR